MNSLLKQAFEAVSRLPTEEQDEIARLVLDLASGDAELEEVDPAHLTDVLEGLSQARRREFASDSEIEAVFRLFGG